MPQLETYWIASQLFWLFLTFAILYVVMVRAGLPRLGEVLQNRRERIADDLEDAERANKESQALEQENLLQLNTARTRAQEIVIEMQKETDALVNLRQAELEKNLQVKAAQSQAEIERARKETFDRLVPVSVELTQELLKKVANLNLPKEKIEQAVQARMRKIHG